MNQNAPAKTYLPSVLICSVIGIVTLAFTLLIFVTEPEAQKEAKTLRTPMLVSVVEVKKGDYRPKLRAMGEVVPAQRVTINSRVSGEVIGLGENFVPGRRVVKGDLLLQVDPFDYRANLARAKDAYTSAKSSLQIEMGEQALAKREFEKLAENLTDMQKALVLRKPQLNIAKARVSTAEVNLQQAQRELERTRISAPFDALILNRKTDIGGQVTQGDELALLIGTQRYWVEASLPLRMAAWLGTNPVGRPVRVRDNHWPDGQYRTGEIHSFINVLNDEARMVRVLIEVVDPQAIQKDNAGQPKLVVGSYVHSEISGMNLNDIVRLPREYIRKNETVWVMAEQQLDIRSVKVLLQDDEYAYIDQGLETGEKIVVTSLSRIQKGAPLRVQEALSGE